MKTSYKSRDILFPVPPALIVSGIGEKANIITIAWIGIMGSNPPALGISLSNNRYSLGLLRETKEFSVNIPTATFYKEVDYCGIVSGSKENKFIKTGFTTSTSKYIKPPIINECPLNLECRILNEIEIGTWTLVLGEILEASIDIEFFDADGNVSVEKIDPLVYIPTLREYWTIGKKLGNSFSVGKSL